MVELAKASIEEKGGVEVDILSLDRARLRVRAEYPPLQGLLLDLAGTLSLAMLLLSEPQPRSSSGLDERDLSALGRGAWRHDHHPG